jgi:methionyl aminopeptidase
MVAIIKKPSELTKLRLCGTIVADIHRELKKVVQVGITTLELEQVTLDVLAKHGAKPSFLGYKGFPYATCISVNEVIVHGFPGEYRLQEGDVVGFDVGAYKNGYHGDAAFTTIVGKATSKLDELLVATCELCLTNAIKLIRDGVPVGAIGYVIEETASSFGFDIVRNYVGHGIGQNLHELPRVYNFGKYTEGLVLKEGMVICIEPMLTIGSSYNYVLDDGWTVVTGTGNNAAHFEHQVIVCKNGAEVISA